MAKHTIDTLTAELDGFKRASGSNFKTIFTTLGDIQPKVQEMHDFIVEQRGFERGRGDSKTININREVWSLIIKLVLIISAILGVNHIQ